VKPDRTISQARPSLIALLYQFAKGQVEVRRIGRIDFQAAIIQITVGDGRRRQLLVTSNQERGRAARVGAV
jgi:hypothetical protein